MSKTDRRVLIICLVVCLLSLPLFFQDIYLFIFPTSQISTDQKIGAILNPQNDVRFKTKDGLGWNSVLNKESDLLLGGSIFSGAGSSAKVQLDTGTSIQMKENSLIKFIRVDQFTIPDLKFGSIEVNATSDIKIMSGGELFLIKKGSGKLRIVSDETGVHAFDEHNRRVSLKPNQTPQAPTLAEIPKTAPLIRVSDLIPTDQRIEFAVKLEDLFEPSQEETHVYLAKQSDYLKRDIYFSWQTSAPALKQKVEYSAWYDMQNSKQFELQSKNQLLISELFIGANFWRVQSDQSEWSKIQSFEVALTEVPTQLQIFTNNSNPWTQLAPAELLLKLRGAKNSLTAAILVQVSTDASDDFIGSKAFLFKPDEEIKIELPNSGIYLIKAREVLSDHRLSVATNSFSIELRKPELPAPPEFTQLGYQLSLEQSANLKWKSLTPAKQYEVEIRDIKSGEVRRFKQTSNQLQFKTEHPSQFEIRVRLEDQFKQKSAWSLASKVESFAPVAVIEPPPKEERKIETRVTKNELPRPVLPPYLNRRYDDPSVDVEISGYASTSSEQKIEGRQVALGSILGVRLRYDLKPKQTAEALLKAKTISLSESAHDSMWLADLRYYYRFQNALMPSWGWRPFLSLGVGYEMYRAQSQKIFSPAYDLMKVGVRIHFPYQKLWTMGGDVFYGQGFDSSTKTEISGNFGYFFDPNFSAGLGYRVYFFEAGSNSAAPQGLPYREAFGEGYSVIKYHF